MIKTQADKHRDALKDNINDAIKNLSAIVIDQVWGWDEFSKEYLHTLQSTLNDLLYIHADLI